MAEIDALFGDSETLNRTYRGVKVSFSFNPNKISAGQMAAWAAELADQMLTDDIYYPHVAGRLEEILVDWDFTRKGQAVPVNKEEILKLPYPMLNWMMNEIMGAMRPGESEGTSEDSGGRPESPERSRPGTSSFG